jgi:hypothetical protein
MFVVKTYHQSFTFLSLYKKKAYLYKHTHTHKHIQRKDKTEDNQNNLYRSLKKFGAESNVT